TLSLHDALPISNTGSGLLQRADANDGGGIIEAEIHLTKRPKLCRQAEPLLSEIYSNRLHKIKVVCNKARDGSIVAADCCADVALGCWTDSASSVREHGSKAPSSRSFSLRLLP